MPPPIIGHTVAEVSLAKEEPSVHLSAKERQILAASRRVIGINLQEAHNAEASNDFGSLGDPATSRHKPKGEGPYPGR